MSKTQVRRGSFRAAILNNAAEQRSKGTSHEHLVLPRSVNMFKEKAGGSAAFDILPYFVTDAHHPDRNDEFGAAVAGDLWYRRPYQRHGRVGVGDTSVVCPAGFGKKCPICEEHEKRLAEGAEWKSPEMGALRPQKRNLYYVVFPAAFGDYEAQRPYLWDVAHGNFQKLLLEELEMNEEFGDFAQLDGGLTLNVRFAKKTFNGNEYAEASRIDFQARRHKYTEELVRDLTSLDEILVTTSYAEISRIFFDTSGDDEGGETLGDGGSDSDRMGTSRPRRSLDLDPNNGQEDLPATFDSGKSAGTATHAEANGDNKCPHGYRFGWDVDAKPECKECKVWGECMDTKEENVGVAEKTNTAKAIDDEIPF